MTIYTTTQARAKLFSLVEETNANHEPIYINGKRCDAVLMSREDYEAIVETLYIQSTPGLTKKILDASNEPNDECVSHEDAWK